LPRSQVGIVFDVCEFMHRAEARIMGFRKLKLFATTVSGFLLGVLCLVLDAVCFGFYSVLVRRMRAKYSPVTITAATMLMGTLGLVAVAAFTERWDTLRLLSAGQWGAVAYLAGVCSILAYLAYNRALVTFPASRAASWIYLESPVAIVLGVAVLGETLSPMTVAGAVVVVGSLVAMERR